MKPLLLLSVLVLAECHPRMAVEFPRRSVVDPNPFMPSCFEFEHSTTFNGRFVSCQMVWCSFDAMRLDGGPAVLRCLDEERGEP